MQNIVQMNSKINRYISFIIAVLWIFFLKISIQMSSKPESLDPVENSSTKSVSFIDYENSLSN